VVKSVFFRNALFATVAVLSGNSPPVAAATFTLEQTVTDTFIKMHGEVTEGDYDRFVSVVESTEKRFTLVLESPGGRLSEAIKIMDFLESLSQDEGSLVPADATCFSACAFIFMSGGDSPSVRKIHYTARLGFHAPWVSGLETQATTFTFSDLSHAYQQGQQVVRRLLANKMMSNDLITELLSKGPDELYLIDTVKKAVDYGIGVTGYFDPHLHQQAFPKAEGAQPWYFVHYISDPVPPSRETACWACMWISENRLAVSKPTFKSFDEWVGDELKAAGIKDMFLQIERRESDDAVMFRINIVESKPDRSETVFERLCSVTFTKDGGLNIETFDDPRRYVEWANPLTALPPDLALQDIPKFISTFGSR
jgi:ATP-dependent protease ClpP protease subunit